MQDLKNTRCPTFLPVQKHEAGACKTENEHLWMIQHKNQGRHRFVFKVVQKLFRKAKIFRIRIREKISKRRTEQYEPLVFYLSCGFKSGVFSNFPWCKFATITTALIAALFLRENDFYSTPRVDLFCALCTSWSVAKYCCLCWWLILFDTRSTALHYCTKAVSGNVCLVILYLLRIKCSAFSTRCSEFWSSVREKHNRVLLTTRILSLSSRLNEDGRSSTAVTPNHGKACRNDAVATSATTRNAGSRTAVSRPSWSSRTTIPRDNRRTWRPCFNSLRNPLNRGRSYSQLPLPPLNFFALWLYFGAVEGLLVAVSHLLRELMLFQMAERRRLFSPTSRRRCTSCFQTLRHKNAAEGYQQSYDGSDRGVHEGAVWSNPFRHPGAFLSSGLPCNVDPGSPSKSWRHAYVKQRPRAILLPLPVPWTKHYLRASFARWTMKRFLKGTF